MKAYRILDGKEVERGHAVAIYKLMSDNKTWQYTGLTGFFEEVTPSGLVNYEMGGDPRQCLPEGLGLRIE